MGTTNKIIKEMIKAVPNAVPSKSLRPVAKAIREEHNITESVPVIMEALNKQFAENPEAAQAANQFRGNPGKILDAVKDKIDVKQLRSDMQQPPRAGRQESIQPEPFTPPTVVSKAPVPALTQGAQLVAKPEPPLMNAIYTPPGGNEVSVRQLEGTPGQKLLPEAQPRTLEEKINAGVQRDEYVSQPQPAEATPGSKGKVAAGVGGAAAAGTVAAALAGRKDTEEKAPTTPPIVGEISTSGPFAGKIAPTGAERAASRDIPFDYYDSLNKEADKRIAQQKEAAKQAGLSSLPQQREVEIRQQVLDEARKAGSKLSPEDEKAAAAGKSYIDSLIPGGARTAGKLELGSRTALTPGVDGAKPSVTKPVTGGGESQVSPTGALKSMGALATKIEKGGSNNVSKPTLDELTKTLDAVEATVSKDPRFQNTPVERNLQSARAEAYKMYKEKADRNQLLGTVERAINAIAQFASAQAGFGTRQAGGNLPLSSADYGGQTAQAFKEYETEVGLIGEEQKAGERAFDRKEALKEKEINRQQRTILERIETERNALKETAAENRARIAEGGRQASLNAAEARAIKRENDAIAKGNVKDITKNLSVLDAEVAALTSMLNPVKPADAVLGLNKYAALTGVDVGAVKEGIAAVSGISWKEGDITPSFTSNKVATKEFATVELEKVRARRKELADSLAQYTKSVPPATEAPTGQPTVSSGMVDMIDPQGRPLRVPENKVAELEAAGAKRK